MAREYRLEWISWTSNSSTPFPPQRGGKPYSSLLSGTNPPLHEQCIAQAIRNAERRLTNRHIWFRVSQCRSTRQEWLGLRTSRGCAPAPSFGAMCRTEDGNLAISKLKGFLGLDQSDLAATKSHASREGSLRLIGDLRRWTRFVSRSSAISRSSSSRAK